MRGCYGSDMDDGGFTCPHCEAVLDATPGESPLDLVCPRCGGFIVIPPAGATVEHPDHAAPPLARDDELSGFRMRQHAGARRAAYRSRSHCVIGALVCVVAVVQLTWTGFSTLRGAGWGLGPIAYLLAAMLAAWGAVYFFRKAMEFDREARQSALSDAADAPDFTPLGDGSQKWRDLEDVR